MGRRRLMSVLAGAIAVVGLHAAPATALPGASVDTSDGLSVEAEVDEAIDDVVDVDPKVEVEVTPKPKAEVDGGAKVADQEIDAATATEAPEEKVEGSGATQPAPNASEAPVKSAEATAGPEQEAEPAPADDQVVAAGTAAPFSLEQAARIEAFRAIRDEIATPSVAAARFDGRVVPGVQLAPRLGDGDTDLAIAPEVAPGVEVAAPSSTVEPQEAPRSAELASAPFSGVLPEVPVALQLLAGTLVAGAALAWHIARRELETSPSLRRSAD
jgi:hypothetical protein